MKKSYILLSTIILVLLFSFLAKDSLEVSALNNRVNTEKLHYIQAKAHIYFLEKYILSLDQTKLEDLQSFEFFSDNFLLKIEVIQKNKSYLLSVLNEDLGVRISKILYL